MLRKPSSKGLCAALIAGTLAINAPISAAMAQPFGPEGTFMGPGMMMMGGPRGSWMMGSRGTGVCSPAATGFVEWRTENLVTGIKLTDDQRAKFEDFKTASVKAALIIRNICQQEVPATIVGRAEAMEKRMDAMLQAIRATRPSLEAFYATLNDDQKARLNAPYDRSFWHWRNYW